MESSFKLEEYKMNGINVNASVHQPIELEKSTRTKQVEEVKEQYKENKAAQISQILSEVQSLVDTRSNGTSFEQDYQQFQSFLSDIGYEGEPIASLSQEEATQLVSEDGFFGVKQTSERIANFVIQGSGGDEELLREGRKGILQGFDQAEAQWGGKLPDIAYETISKAVEMIDKALIEGGFSILNEQA
ncbi:hypothetical protein JHD50_00120 [Sulfurimonas sp. MAG313]|nr:hypothetical protein [Sulfurimonas sp. MAG313]MDF1879719.1 hypothetical protein [Sulfurimonas sp. MAG313]